MAQSKWQHVRKQLGRSPIVEGTILGDNPLYVERYLYQTVDAMVSALGCAGIVTQLGGGRVTEGVSDRLRSENLPSQSLLVPAGVPTHWHYSGTVDFTACYFLDEDHGLAQQLSVLAKARDEPIPFSDPLVGAAAMQLANELGKGQGADEGFMGRLASVMLEQVFRVLTIPGTHGINPRHVHFSRLQAVLNHIPEHLTDDVSAAALANLAQVSPAHFRRIFHDAMGMPPHRYVLGVRLEKARKLLTMSSMPLARIAQECGFSSQSHFTASFRAAHGATPAAFRAQTQSKAGA